MGCKRAYTIDTSSHVPNAKVVILVAFSKTYTITTLGSLKRAVGHLYSVKRGIAKIEQDRNKAIIKLNEDADKELKPLRNEHAALVAAIWRFVLGHLPEVFGKAKEAKFASAVIVRTPSAPTEVLDEELLIKALRELKSDYAVKRVDSVQLAVLNAHPELIEEIQKRFPGAIRRPNYLNLRLNYRPRGRKDQLGATLTAETHKARLED